MEKLFERFLAGNKSFIEQEVVPETRVEKVSYKMLLSAHIKIDGHPVFQQIVICKFFVVVRIAVS